jgi:hypothetical protein
MCPGEDHNIVLDLSRKSLSIHTYPNQPEIEEQAALFLNVLAPPPAISLLEVS